MTPHAALTHRCADLWHGRRRRFDDDEEGMASTEAMLEKVIELAGSTDLACHLIFECERDVLAIAQPRRPASRRAARPARPGLGQSRPPHISLFAPLLPANHDDMFKRLGFELRERSTPAPMPAGARRSSSIPSPESSYSPISISRPRKPPRISPIRLSRPAAPGTVGLWVALHGESILEAGMHHLKAQYDFDALKDGLKAEAAIETMTPFSDFPFCDKRSP